MLFAECVDVVETCLKEFGVRIIVISCCMTGWVQSGEPSNWPTLGAGCTAGTDCMIVELGTCASDSRRW